MDAVDATTYTGYRRLENEAPAISLLFYFLLEIAATTTRPVKKSALILFNIYYEKKRRKAPVSGGNTKIGALISEHREREKRQLLLIVRCCCYWWWCVNQLDSTCVCFIYTRQKISPSSHTLETCVVVVVVVGGCPAAIIRHSGRDELGAQRESALEQSNQKITSTTFCAVCVSSLSLSLAPGL
jgi:hypothetical protein